MLALISLAANLDISSLTVQALNEDGEQDISDASYLTDTDCIVRGDMVETVPYINSNSFVTGLTNSKAWMEASTWINNPNDRPNNCWPFLLPFIQSKCISSTYTLCKPWTKVFNEQIYTPSHYATASEYDRFTEVYGIKFNAVAYKFMSSDLSIRLKFGVAILKRLSSGFIMIYFERTSGAILKAHSIPAS